MDGKRKSLETTNWNQAVELLGALRKVYHANRVDRIFGKSGKTLRQFREDYERTMAGGRNPDTLRADLLALRKLEVIHRPRHPT